MQKQKTLRTLHVACACVAAMGSFGHAQEMQAEPDAPVILEIIADSVIDGIGYPVGKLVFQYPFEHIDLPDLHVLNDLVVLLSPVDDGWVGVRETSDVHAVRLGDIGSKGVEVVYGSALAAINQGIRDFLEAEYGLIGHLVTPDASEIAYRSPERTDLRNAENTTLTILVWRAVVGEVRTVAHGDRLGEQKADDLGVSNINRKEHGHVRDRLRVKQGELLTRDRIDDEIHRLNRHPGRRVDVAIAPTDQPGEVIVDYLITEPKPWTAYAQTSNTGTESTDVWQQRFGFVHRQLIGRDDVLKIDYITTGFDETHAVLGSYTFDVGPKSRLKLFGRWNEYTAKDVGLGFENFKGNGYALGAELAINVWQDGPKFLDVVLGVRGEHIRVENRLFLLEGEDDFFLPSVGVRYQKSTPIHSAYGELILESNWGAVVGSSKEDVQRLGRFGADDDFTILRGQLSHSFYLEPIFDPGGFKGDRGTDGMTLAHEVAMSLRGQYSFQSRLVPNYEFVAGGFYTVRGYPESAAVGDDAILASVEYRFHLGRSLPARSETANIFGKPFRTARARPYGRADWDLIFKGFIDAARLVRSLNRPRRLWGLGLGLRLSFARI